MRTVSLSAGLDHQSARPDNQAIRQSGQQEQ